MFLKRKGDHLLSLPLLAGMWGQTKQPPWISDASLLHQSRTTYPICFWAVTSSEPFSLHCRLRQLGQSRAENRPVSCQAVGRSLGEARPSSGVGVGCGPGLCTGHLGWTCRWWRWAVSGTTPGRLHWNSSAPGRRRTSRGPGTRNLVLCPFVQLPMGSSRARAVGKGVVFCFPSPSVSGSCSYC